MGLFGISHATFTKRHHHSRQYLSQMSGCILRSIVQTFILLKHYSLSVTLLPFVALRLLPFSSMSSILSGACSEPSLLETSPLPLLLSFLFFLQIASKLNAPATSPTGGTNQQTLHHQPESPPCCAFHLATVLSTWSFRSENEPELSMTDVA